MLLERKNRYKKFDFAAFVNRDEEYEIKQAEISAIKQTDRASSASNN